MNRVSYNWYLGLRQSISDAGANPSAIASAVSDYLTAHPVTIDSLAATKVTTDSTHRFTLTQWQVSWQELRPGLLPLLRLKQIHKWWCFRQQNRLVFAKMT